jgi:Ca-activated chloride channel family protein
MNLSSFNLFDRKVLRFGGFGALGCLLAAILGEPWLWLTGSGQGREPISICLLLDSSGSMAGENLEEMKQAASDFVQRRDLSQDQISVVNFDSRAKIQSQLVQDKQSLINSINQISVGGSTNMSDGLLVALSTLPDNPTRKFILLFTDGQPDSESATTQSAALASEKEVLIMAIATGDANQSFLAQLTKDPRHVFPASDGQFGTAFQGAEKSMYDLVGSGAGSTGVNWSMFRVGVWTLLLATGIGLALIAAQNLYLHQVALTKKEALIGGVGSAAIGLFAGGLSQGLLYFALEQGGFLMVLGRMTGWALMGALLGYGLGWFIPNLKHLRGLAGGLAGGIAGVVCFLILGVIFADTVGRLAGAAMLGFCIGAMIALLEAALREAWLEIDYGNGEIRKVSLGREPVSIGGDASRCTVFIRQAPPRAYEYILKDGEALCRDLVNDRETAVSPGDVKSIGNIAIRLKTAQSVNPTSKSAAQSLVGGSRSTINTSSTKKPNKDVDVQNSVRDGFEILIQGKKIALKLGTKLHVKDIPGIESVEPEKVVAEVVTNPQDPTILGLKNLMSTPWQSKSSAGRQSQIDQGRTVRLEAGTRITFANSSEGVIV